MNSENSAVVGESISRRQVRDPEMIRRIRSEMTRAAVAVHQRRMREWAMSDTGSLPTHAESQRIAVEEVEYLIRALGPLAGVDGDDLFGPATGRFWRALRDGE